MWLPQVSAGMESQREPLGKSRGPGLRTYCGKKEAGLRTGIIYAVNGPYKYFTHHPSTPQLTFFKNLISLSETFKFQPRIFLSAKTKCVHLPHTYIEAVSHIISTRQ